MAYDIGPKITLKGEQEFNKSLQSINNSLKEYGSELKAVDASMAASGATTEALQRKAELLQKQFEEQQKKLKTYQDQLEKLTKKHEEEAKAVEEAKAKYGENSTEVQKAQKAYETTEGQISRLNVAINETTAYAEQSKKAIADNTAELEKLSTQADKAKLNLDKIGDTLTSAGKKMLPVTAGVTAVGTAAMAAWSEIDEAYDSIVAGTGATGEALEDLQGSFDSVFGSIPTTASDAATAIADVNTRFGFTGDQLEAASEKFLKFAEVNGTDVSSAIENVHKAMADAGIDLGLYSQVMDELTVASQASGLGIDTLSASLSENGVTMRELGFNTEETIALLGTMEKHGVNTSTVLTGMKSAVKVYAKEGKDASVEIEKLFTSIQNGTTSAANAQEIFGTKAGAAIYQYVQDGKLEFSDLLQTVQNASGGLDQSFNDMLDPADQAKVAFQNLKLAGAELGDAMQETVAPILESAAVSVKAFAQWFKNLPDPIKRLIVVIGGMVAAVGPLLMAGGTMAKGLQSIVSIVPTVTKLFGGLSSALSGLFSLIMAHPVIAVITAIVAALVFLYNNCEEFREFVDAMIKAICEWLQKAVDAIVKWFRDDLPGVIEGFKQSWSGMCDGVKGAWDGFWSFVSSIGQKIAAFFRDSWSEIQKFISDPFGNAFKLVNQVTGGFFSDVMGWCGRIIDGITGFFGGLGSKALQWGKDMLDGFISGIQAMFKPLTDTVSWVADGIASFLHFSVPDKGPLSDFDESGGDMIDLLIDGIKQRRGKLEKTIEDVARMMDFDASVQVTGTSMPVIQTQLYLDGKQIKVATSNHAIRDDRAAKVARGEV